jgi:hypothetical protein
LYINFDWGHDKLDHNGPSFTYYGIAFAGRYQLAKKFAFAPRVEIYNDGDGFWTGAKQTIKELTVTGEYKHNDYFTTRVEYRRDWADKPIFFMGNQNLPIDRQGTFLVAMLMYIGPKK